MYSVDDTTIGVIGIATVSIAGIAVIGYGYMTGIQSMSEVTTMVVSVVGVIGALIKSFSGKPPSGNAE